MITDAKTTLCPRCGHDHYTPYDVKLTEGERQEIRDRMRPMFPALSRANNKTYICTTCGQDEAMRDWQSLPPIPLDEWPLP